MTKALHRVWEISQDAQLREYEEARQKQYLDQLTNESTKFCLKSQIQVHDPLLKGSWNCWRKYRRRRISIQPN